MGDPHLETLQKKQQHVCRSHCFNKQKYNDELQIKGADAYYCFQCWRCTKQEIQI